MTNSPTSSTPRNQFSGLRAIVAAFALASTVPLLSAQEKPAAPNATGTWKVSFAGLDGQPVEVTIKLKQDGAKLSGAFVDRRGETAIEAGKIAGDELSFDLNRERNGQTLSSKINGKIAGDVIKGKINVAFGGETLALDWEGKRVVPSVAGSWKYTLQVTVDQELEFVADLKQDGQKVTGQIKAGEFDSAISEGSFKDGQVSFHVVRERDGRKYTSKYTGRLEGDSVRGKIHSDYGPTERVFEWSATRAKP